MTQKGNLDVFTFQQEVWEAISDKLQMGLCVSSTARSRIPTGCKQCVLYILVCHLKKAGPLPLGEKGETLPGAMLAST